MADSTKNQSHTGSQTTQGRNASSQADRSQSQTGSTRGGTHEQHVKAGHLGGVAPHECRGNECHKGEHKSGEHKSSK